MQDILVQFRTVTASKQHLLHAFCNALHKFTALTSYAKFDDVIIITCNITGLTAISINNNNALQFSTKEQAFDTLEQLLQLPKGVHIFEIK